MYSLKYLSYEDLEVFYLEVAQLLLFSTYLENNPYELFELIYKTFIKEMKEENYWNPKSFCILIICGKISGWHC